jgi:hypothetical protein
MLFHLKCHGGGTNPLGLPLSQSRWQGTLRALAGAQASPGLPSSCSTFFVGVLPLRQPLRRHPHDGCDRTMGDVGSLPQRLIADEHSWRRRERWKTCRLGKCGHGDVEISSYLVTVKCYDYKWEFLKSVVHFPRKILCNKHGPLSIN